MTILQPVKSGDKGIVRTVQLTGIDDLDAVTSLRAIVKHAKIKTEPTAVLVATIVDSAQRIIAIDCGTTDLDWLPSEPRRGNWHIEYELTFGAAGPQTWPNRGYDTLPVFSDLD